jgi:Holliday junction DNA helicase RuvB
LATAVSALPTALCELAEDDDVARGLLRDINLLRGTEVFDFLREISRNSHIYLMDGLDNVLALRFLLSDDAQLPGYLPVVVAMKDLTARSAPLSELRRGTQCDDVLVFYLPKFERAPPVVLYRLVEVKFGPRRGRPRTKAQQQLSETAQKLAMKLPTGRWLSEQSPTALLLERDVAWTLHEALERLRAFGLLPDDEAMEAEWGLRGLFGCLHRGDFELKPYVAGFPGASQLVNGTAMMLDPNIPGDSIDVTVEGATEYLTIPLGLIADLLVNPVTGVAGHAIEARKAIPPPASGLTTTSPDEPETPARETSAESTGRPPTGGPADGGDETHSGEGGGQKVEAATPTNQPMALSSDLRGTEKSAGDEEGRTRPRADADSARDEALLRVDQVFDGFIGNTGPVTRLKRALTIASLEGRRWIEPVGLFGPKSTGKTELARRISRALGLPKAELSETLLRGADDLARKIQETANEAGSTMRMESDPHGGVTLHAPPMVVFIDEVHLLRSAVQDSLLKALEPDDRTLLSTLGTIDTRQVTFIIATTDPGRLREPFKNRVARYELREYTLDELTQILAAHRERRDDIPAEASQFNDECLEVFARVGRHVPREALRLMREAARAVRVGFLNPTLEALKTQYRDEYGADDTGLRTGDRDYLRILFPDFTVGVEALAAQLGVDPNNVSEDLEPYLLRLGLIERGRTGRRLTAQGREFASSLPD